LLLKLFPGADCVKELDRVGSLGSQDEFTAPS